MSVVAGQLEVDLPAEVVVLALPGKPPALDTSLAAGGLLLQAVWPAPPGVDVPVGIALTVAPLPVDPHEPVLPGLHAWAVSRTSRSGQVEVLATPLGLAIAVADVVDVGADDALLPVCLAQVLLPGAGALLTLSVSCPGADDLGGTAALAALLAARWRSPTTPIDLGTEPAP